MTQTTGVDGPLVGLRVVELTHIMAGPTCGRMLADMGADVIKVERAPKGDLSRWDTIADDNIDGETASFMIMNRNKRGIAIDLKNERGLDVMRRLLAGADVLVENFRPGALDRLGLGYQDLKRLNPRLIYCAISGFGRTGPYAQRPGLDLISQAMSGIMSITGEGPDTPPLKCGAPITDIGAGMLGAMGILAAIYRRDKTGEGEMVDTSLFEAGITFTYWQSALFMATGVAPRAMGTAHPLGVPYEAFQTADGWITIGTHGESGWYKLLDILAVPELGDDPRFATTAVRMDNRLALAAALGAQFAKQPSEHWLDELEVAGIPAGPVLDIGEMQRDPQVVARDMVTTVEHSRLGPVETIGCPVKFTEAPVDVQAGAPLLGEHTRAVLGEIGYNAEEIDHLIADGAVTAV